MGIRYDKIVARKKAKLRELEREAKTHDLIDRDDCRSEKSDVVRMGSQGHVNVGFRVVRVEK